MAIYYVDSGLPGNDANDGLSMGTPFLTIQHAHDLTNPGDTVYILPGKGYGGGVGAVNPLTITRSGSVAGGYITYMGYPGLPMPVINGTQSWSVIQFQAPCSYIIIQGLEIAGWNGSLTLATAWVAASSTTTYDSSPKFNGSGIGGGGLTAVSTATNGSTAAGNPTLHFATSQLAAGAAVGYVVFDTSDLTAIPAGTTVTAFGGSGSAWTVTMSANAIGSGVASGATVKFMAPLHHLQVLGCRVHDFPAGGINLYLCDYITFQGNWVYNNAYYSPDQNSGINIAFAIDIDTVTTYKNFVNGNVSWANQNLIASAFSGLNTTSTGAANTAGATTLTVTTTSGVNPGYQVFDQTTPTCITPGTVVSTVTDGTHVVITPAIATTIAAGHNIRFAMFTDGEGIIIDDNRGNQQNTKQYAGRTLVTNNLCVGNGGPGVLVFDSSHVDVAFNTCYLNVITAFYATGFAGPVGNLEGNIPIDCNFYNNIAQASGTTKCIISVTPTTTTFSTNLGFGGDGTALPGSGNITGSDPLFVAPTAIMPTPTFPISFTGFQLQPGSPAIDVASASYTRTTDILGNLGQFGSVASDIGAYESPNSTWGGNSISTITSLMTALADNTSGQITPAKIRTLVATLWAGRSPYPK